VTPPPLPSAETRSLIAVGARRSRPGIPATSELIQELRRLNAADPALVALFDAAAIAGERHLLSAWAHLGRARARGEERLRDRSAEYALFVAGDDQLPRALGKVGFSDATERFVVVMEKPRDPNLILDAFRLQPDPTAYPRPPDAALLDRLGIDAADRSVVPESEWEALVLERVALLELSAAHSARSRAKH
jgi:tRNA threonylcarbamoyladenosine modification (KEOPS) complex Cgi121 subunit